MNEERRRKQSRIPTSRTAIVLVVLGLAALASARSGGEEEGSSQKAGKRFGEPMAFSHTRHVPPSWLFPWDEVARDCRGCHDFTADSPSDWPQPTERCTSCHVYGSFTFEGSPAGDPSRFPEHTDHLSLNCSECHVLPDDAEEVPQYIPVPVRDTGFCVRCHEERSSMGDRAEEDRKRAARIAARADRPLRFLHSQHLAADQFADADTCQRCHTELADSDAANLGEKQFDPNSCDACHTAKFEVEAYRRPSSTAAAFWHELHLGPKALRIEERLSGERCAACHEYDAELENYRLADFFLATGDAHDGCVTCHEHTEWRVERHGETDECAQCHALQGGSLSEFADMATNRPRATLLRPRPVGFRFGAHPHPLVTTAATGAIDEDCATCHRASVPELPSRLERRPFDHASHLPARYGELGAEDCQACHRAVGSEAFNRLRDQLEEAEAPEAEPTMIYEDASCTGCHGEEFETVLPADRLRSVLWFSHSEHLRRRHPVTGERFDCLHCHVQPENGDAFRVRVPDEVADCTQCHGHADHHETTGGFDQAAVDSCVECHRLSPIPERGVPLEVERLRIARKVGVETHDRGGACSNCHQTAPLQQGERMAVHPEPSARSIFATRQFVIHADERNPEFPENRFFNKDEAAREYCVDCHWESQRHQWRRSSEFEQEPYYEPGLSDTKLREGMGDRLEGFPGFAKPR